MATLIDAYHGLTKDIPWPTRKQPRWLHAGMLLVTAAETGTAEDIFAATDALLAAVEHEGWMNRPSS